jgi:opacity protein-like surface antigen
VKFQRLAPLLILAAAGAFADDSYYGALRINSARYQAHDMDSSARPGLGQFVPGDESNTATGGSLALGYQLPSNWRVEAEYTLPKNNEFTSGSTRFPTSFNHHQIRSQRLMVNAYKDFPLNSQFSLYGMAGLGLARLESSGWQGNPGRQYISDTQNNLAYSVGLASAIRLSRSSASIWAGAMSTWARPRAVPTTSPTSAACRTSRCVPS